MANTKEYRNLVEYTYQIVIFTLNCCSFDQQNWEKGHFAEMTSVPLGCL